MEHGNMCCVKWPQITTTATLLCSKTIMGTCSLCGGRVTVPTVWMGINPPDPTCEQCGAMCYGPVIDMRPPPITYIPAMPIYPVERVERVYKLTDPPEPRGRKVREGRGWS